MNDPHIVQTDRLALNARIEGNGPPLLFLGGSSFDLSIKALVFESDLVNHFTVAAADPRGLGNSEMPSGTWTMKDYALDAESFMNALGWPSAYVVGESFGAMVAMELALLAPQRVAKLALAAGAPGGDGGSSYPIHELLKIDNHRERVVRSLHIQDSRFKDLLENNPTEAETRIDSRMQSDQLFLQHAENSVGYPRLLACRAQHDCWDKLPNLLSETLIIAGRFDNQAPMDRAEAMARRIPMATLQRFDDGHNVLFASPGPVQGIMDSWLNSDDVMATTG